MSGSLRAQEREVHRRQTMLSRPGATFAKFPRFHRAPPLRSLPDLARRQFRFQQRTHVAPHLFALRRTNHTGRFSVVSNRTVANRQLRACSTACSRRMLISRLPRPNPRCNAVLQPARGEYRFPAEPRFLSGADHFQRIPALFLIVRTNAWRFLPLRGWRSWLPRGTASLRTLPSLHENGGRL